MRSSLWFFFALFSLVFAVPLKLEEQQPLSSLKTSWYSASHRNADSHYPSLNARLRRALLTQRRKLEFAWRDRWEYMWPKIKPEKVDVFLLRKQEDALFMTPKALFQSLPPRTPPKVRSKPGNRSIHPEFFRLLKTEVMRRPTSKNPEWVFRVRIKADASEL